jgi:hypothetical protein
VLLHSTGADPHPIGDFGVGQPFEAPKNEALAASRRKFSNGLCENCQSLPADDLPLRIRPIIGSIQGASVDETSLEAHSMAMVISNEIREYAVEIGPWIERQVVASRHQP